TTNWQLRQTTTANVSRRPVLSVRKRIINTPHSSSSSSSSLSSSSSSAAAATSSSSLTQNAEFTTTTSKYNRLRSRLATTTITPAAANKLKSTGESATLLPATSHSNNNDIISQHKFQPASFALRRQFQTRRLTTLAPSTIADDSATEVPHTQNPLFKRRLTLTSTISAPRTTTVSATSETTTNLYANDDDDDQIAKSSIHTSRFNQILSEHGHSREDFDPPSSSSSSRPPTPPTKQPTEIGALSQGLRRQLIPRPRRPHSTTQTPATTAASNLDYSSPPLSRRQQSRRRPHKYIEVYSRPPSKPELASATLSRRRSASVDSDYYDNGQQQLTPGQRQRQKNSQPSSDPKVIVHGRGVIECLAQGNFPHPLNCRKFISCAKFEETGGIVGWEYTCPKGLTYDGVDGMCTPWSTSSGVEGGCRA
ncbi:uncharacterized protein DDB_G0271670-like, partial [Drosophila willistoni]|uniref:uncharacterized protein DDB_G0271670-like n=1 Tax=Drosophila willistoni TaxID=7260 RepID=UPI001F081F29